MNTNSVPAWVKRLLACLAGGVVLAMMVGNQEGSQTDWSEGFTASVLKLRIVGFLAAGVLLFLAITFWSRLQAHVTKPGFWPLLSGALAVVSGTALMNWNDQLGDNKFSAVRSAVNAAPDSVSWLTHAYVDWLAWAFLVIAVVAGGVAAVSRKTWIGYAVVVWSLLAAGVAYASHSDISSAARRLGPDHSLGYAVVILGYLVIVSAMLTTVAARSDNARARELLDRVLSFRPGLALVVLAAVATLLATTIAIWFSPGDRNLDEVGTHNILVGSSISSFALTFLSWLSWALAVLTVIVSGAAAWLRNRLLGVLGGVLGLAGTIMTLVALYDISKTGADTNHFDGASGPWQNLGSGGWIMASAFFLAGGGGVHALLATRRPRRSAPPAVAAPGRTAARSTKDFTRTFLVIAAAAALFYPPTATPFWQQVVVSEIGISMLLAVGLNVVVGWAGLLDLGFIAFYAIGSYTTAYLTGNLPVKPPSWLELSPLWAIPFAIAICLLAGVILGAPTLRLRGDYLAIVTLGFGEIIRIVAVNAQGFTNGSQGPSGVPNPVVHIGPLHIRWGLAQLQYWYLLLVIFVIVVLAFRRLEHSRLGRSWAAVREDEVAAQAMGINTRNVKLLAFAIGASTSGLAGVFFASQVGSFTPENFVLNNSILIVAYVVFGGMGSLSGAMAGAAMLTWLPRFLQNQVPQSDKLMWIGAIVILMMIFRPAGLMPARRRQIELSHGLEDEARSEPRAVPVGEGL